MKFTIKSIIRKAIPVRIQIKYYEIQNISRKNYSLKKKKKIIDRMYYKHFGKYIDWIHPTTYTEMLNVSKLLCDSEIKTRLTDKYLVREWVKDKIGEKYLVPLVGVYDSFDEIDFLKLPDKFVIKCNHDSGSVYVCANKKNIDIKSLRLRYNFFMKRDYSLVTFESHYHDIKPRILIEQYLDKDINDYKFLCFHGKIYYVWVDFDRFTNHKRNIYDLNWNIQEFNQRSYGNYLKEFNKPNNFNEMIEIVKKLCEGFDQVRVDLYDVEGKIYFGEMTFTNGSGLEPIEPSSYDELLGSLWGLKLEKGSFNN